jgi:UDP-2,4-diacetamido-2,4,6-trideoxy-beta-L-altropyranose hydrolase
MNVAFRVDASTQIGTGHFTRCLALGDALGKLGVRTRFVSRHLPPHLRDLVRGSGHEFAGLSGAPEQHPTEATAHSSWLGTSQRQDAADTIQALSDAHWDWMIVDHYALDARWEAPLRSAAGRIAVIDDIADRSHDCDLLLDQNLHSNGSTRYAGKVPDRSLLLLGPRYALLREEFHAGRQNLAPRGEPVRRMLVFFGGADAGNHTSEAVEALAGLAIPTLHVDVVVGLGHPARDRVASDCLRHGYALHVQTEQMVQLIAAADLGLGAGGSATWERCCLGLPTLALCTAENQREQLSSAARAGLVYAPEFGESDRTGLIQRHVLALIENGPLRYAISAEGMATVDGLGTARVVDSLGAVDGLGLADIEFRAANESDSRKLFEWRNDPAVRAVSRCVDPIEWEDHCQWLAATLKSSDRALLIGESVGLPVGVVRFDLKEDEAEISIYLVPGAHPPGRGRQLLRSAERWLKANRPKVNRITAQVMGGNERSSRMFLGAGYRSGATSYSKRLR